MATAYPYERISLDRQNAVVVINEAYFDERRELNRHAYQLCVEVPTTAPLTVPHMKYMSRTYQAPLKPNEQRRLREKEAFQDAFVVGISGMVDEGSSTLTPAQEKALNETGGCVIENNVTPRAYAFNNPDVKPHTAPAAAAIFTGRMNRLATPIQLCDERGFASGVQGMLMAAAVKNPDLIGLGSSDSLAEATDVSTTEKDRTPQVIQPGVVFCRLGDVLSPRQCEDSPSSRVVLVSEQHLIVLMLAANPHSAGVDHLFSFAYASSDRSISTRVFIMRHKLYAELLSRARHIVRHLQQNLLPLGGVQINWARGITTNPAAAAAATAAATASLENVKQISVTFQLHVQQFIQCNSLLIFGATAEGMFHREQCKLWWVVHPLSAGDTTGIHRQQVSNDKDELFASQRIISKTLHAMYRAKEPQGPVLSAEELVLRWIKTKAATPPPPTIAAAPAAVKDA